MISFTYLWYKLIHILQMIVTTFVHDTPQKDSQEQGSTMTPLPPHLSDHKISFQI